MLIFKRASTSIKLEKLNRMDWTSHNKAPLVIKPRTLTTNINSDAVGLDQEKTLPTDLMKPVMGLIPLAKRTKKNVFTMKARYTSKTKFSFLL